MRKLAVAIALAAAALVAAVWLWPAGGPSDSTGDASGPGSSANPGGARHQAPGAGHHESGAQRERGANEPERAAPALEDGGVAAGSVGFSPEDGHLEVTVRAGGLPMPGALVRLYWRGQRDPNTNHTAWKAAGAAGTDEHGVARLPAGPGTYLLAARADGYAAARQEVLRPAGERLTRVFVALERGSALVGRTLVKGRAEPVPLAELTLVAGGASREPWRRADAPAEERVSAVSDPHGRFRIENLAPGVWRVEARAVGYSKLVQHPVAVPRQDELVLELAAAGVIEGFVVSGDGSPAAGALVSAAGGDEEVVVSTGSGGGFSAEVGQGSFTLSARLGSETGSSSPVTVAAGAQVKGITIRLGAGCVIEGTVVAKTSKAPIAGASVDVSPYKKTGDSGRTVSGADGAFSVGGLAPGSYDVVASAEGLAQLHRRGISVAAGQRFPLKLELEGTGAVEGVVSDEAGRPLAGAIVRGGNRWGGPMGGLGVAEARSDEQGHYQLTGLEAGKARIEARRPEASAGTGKQVDVVEGQIARADFILAENGFVTGTVTRKSGAPLEVPATVRANLRRRDRSGFPDNAMAAVAAGGSYHLTLPPGRWSLSASLDRPGAGFAEGMQTDVEVGKTQRLDLVVKDDEASGIGGVVLEPGGAPSPRAMVAIAGENSRTMMAFPADEEGRFRFPAGAARGAASVSLRARNGGRTSEWVATSSAATEVRLVLRPAASIAGKVEAGDGPPVVSFAVRLALADPGAWRGFFRGDDALEFAGDHFEVVDVPPERLKVTVVTSDGRTGEAEATLAPGGRGQVTVNLLAGASVHGVIVASDSKQPVPEATVSIDGARTDLTRDAVGGDGRFRITNLSPGEHSVRVGAPRHRTDIRKVTLAVGQTLDLGEVVLVRQKVAAGAIGVNLGIAPNGGALQIVWVTPEGPGERAGLREGDVLLAVDGVAVQTPGEASKRIRGTPGTPVHLTIRRGGSTQNVQVTRAS